MMSNNDNMTSDAHVFYGVSLPVDVIHTIDIKLVFDDKKDVLEAIKSHKGSRFKAFNNVDDAIEFSKHAIKPETSSCDPNKDNKNIEKSLSPFSGLHPRELTKLRKAIESDDYETVDQLIWSNPRFLVSSGDTPAILHEAFRYNACHIAAKTNRYRVLELILNTVSDNKFMKLLFPFDTNEVTQSRINFLLDLYLNTPEKGTSKMAQVGEPVKGMVGDRNVSALAGPMSPKQADQLFQSLKSPRRCTPIERRIRLTDSRKGLERVARNLCKDMNIIWAEFWPFLNTRIDLTSDEGLNLLEKHLCHIYYVCVGQPLVSTVDTLYRF
ncbi:unnamed protein product [Medioppia subpectinata]|uniref:ANKLE2 third alpha/beta domain-containing protein n=1 Tax=Medioppia subpectinata TaxID=1979941 RepID=A0A7R9Q0Y3_9ACAR|nr:unnamed protein product [Medioppia subpectinata]CAG2108017.1 unnamed protein product [Medioppia subpectinata]